MARVAVAKFPSELPADACTRLVKEHLLPYAARDHAEGFRSKVGAPCA